MVLPSGLTVIYSYAFNDCSSLTELKLTEGLKSIYECAFSGSAIEEITVPSAVTRLSCDSTTSESSRKSAFLGASNLKKVIFSEGMTVIPVRSLKNCTSVTEVVIPDSVVTIDVRAFQGCTALAYVDLPEYLVTLNGFAFADCTLFADIIFPDTLTAIGEYAFSGCIGLRLINFNEALTNIGRYAFNDCNGLISVTCNGGLATLGEYAFASCDNLESIKIPETVTAIGVKLLNDTPKVTVYCYTDTAAHTHALAYEYSYYLIDENIHSHTYGAEVITEATSARLGIVINTCTDCGYVYTEFNNSCVHTPEYSIVTESTCTSTGMAEVFCSVCGHDLGLEILDMTEHSWEWVQTAAPTVLAVGEEVGTCTLCAATQTREVPKLQPTVVGVDNYVITLENIDAVKEIRYALGTYTTGSEVKAAEKNQTLSASLVAKYTVDGVMTYEVPWMGSYTFWVRLTDGNEYFLHADIDDITPYLESDGVGLTVKDFKDGYKDLWIGQGEWTTYRELKDNAPWSVQISEAKLDTKFYDHDYSYTCVYPGIHTAIIRYNDGTSDVMYINLEVVEPVFNENGLQVTVTNIPDVKMIRTASGKHTTVASMKETSDLRNFSNKTVIKNAESYKIQYRNEGWVTIAVEYDNGYRHFHHYYVQPKAPTFGLEGDTVTLGDLDDMYIIRYAPGEHTISGTIKSATGSEYLKSDSIDENGNIVISGLAVGTWTVMVQYNDESFYFNTFDVE